MFVAGCRNKSVSVEITQRKKTKRGSTITPWVIGLMPFLAFLWAELRYSVNMPNWDDYDSVLGWLLDFSRSTSLEKQAALLLRQHNEHRIVFDRIVEIFELHSLGVVNFVYLNLVGFIGLLSLVSLLIVLGKRSGLSGWALVPIPFFMLSLSQNGLIGFAMASMQVYWALTFSFLSFLFATKDFSYRGLLVAFLFSLIASFTSAGGLIGFPALLLFYVANREYRLSVLWLILSVPVFLVYFVFLHYQPTAIGIESHQYAYTHPIQYAKYAITFLGSMARTHNCALVLGSTLSGAALYLILKRDIPARSWLFVVVIFVAATATADGLSRIILGIAAARSSRYTPFSAILIAAIYIAIISSMKDKARIKLFEMAGLVVSVTVYVLWGCLGIPRLRANEVVMKSQLFYPSQSKAGAILRMAMAKKIFVPLPSVYRNLPAGLPLRVSGLYRNGYFGHIDSVTISGRTIRVSGWAALKQEECPAATVIVDVNGKYYSSTYGMRRPDVAKNFGNPKYVDTGYESNIGMPKGVKGVCKISVIVVGLNRKTFYRSPKKVIACGTGGG